MRRGANCIEWVAVRDAAKYPTVYTEGKTAATTKNYPTLNINNAKVMPSCPKRSYSMP